MIVATSRADASPSAKLSRTSKALAIPSSTNASTATGRAGFARRGMACAEVFGWSGAQFLAAYRANIEQAALDYLENDLVARALLSQSWRGARAWLKEHLAYRGVSKKKVAEATSGARWQEGVVWRGSASDLFAYLEDRAGFHITGKRGWPREVRWFGRMLNLAAVSLRKAGWKVEFSRNGRERIVTIRRIGGWDSEPPDLDGTSQLRMFPHGSGA